MILLFWTLCGLLASGLTFAYLQTRYRNLAKMHVLYDYVIALMLFTMGPMGLITTFIAGSYGYGWRLWVKKEDEE